MKLRNEKGNIYNGWLEWKNWNDTSNHDGNIGRRNRRNMKPEWKEGFKSFEIHSLMKEKNRNTIESKADN